MRVERHLAALALVCVAFAAPAPAQTQTHDVRAASPPAAASKDLDPQRVDLHSRLNDVAVERQGDRVLVRARIDGEERLMTSEAWVASIEAAQRAQRERGFFYVLFDVSKPWGFAWVALGLFGQALFTLRMVLQWWASERRRRSIVPVGFWWSSLAGGILLLVYFVWRKDVVGILGQSTGIFVYARNLVLIHRSPAAPAAAGSTSHS